ncbi:MAG: DUF4363 family protein [Christensenellaceae bacterium]|nr:DUF4363 family protein [Christensenellaceae bacterium]MDD6926759.1 DUF4363 family protein [bacterium]MDY2850669.1 DUF4363 family protein [Christensenellaceae bacterium]
MVKSIVSTLIIATLFIIGAIAENVYVNKTFGDFSEKTQCLIEKCENTSIKPDDLIALQQVWHKNKKSLHVIIPHTEIKEIDLWLSEAIMLSKQNNTTEAVQKLKVIYDLSTQIPKTFNLSFENIF